MTAPTPVSVPGRTSPADPHYLIERSNLDHAGDPDEVQPDIKNVRIRRLNNVIEIYQLDRGWLASFPSGAPVRAGAAGRMDLALQEANRRRADQKARSQVRRLVVSHGLDHMLTLTFAAELKDYKEAWDAFTDWRRRAFRQRGSFLYVAVAAVHEQRTAADGSECWHFHVAVGQPWTKDELAATWGLGTVDHRKFDAPENLAGYLRHNLSISAEHRPTGKRYRAAKGMAAKIKSETVDLAATPEEFAALLEHLIAQNGEVIDLHHLVEWQGTLVRVKFEQPISLEQVTSASVN